MWGQHCSLPDMLYRRAPQKGKTGWRFTHILNGLANKKFEPLPLKWPCTSTKSRNSERERERERERQRQRQRQKQRQREICEFLEDALAIMILEDAPKRVAGVVPQSCPRKGFLQFQSTAMARLEAIGHPKKQGAKAPLFG